MNSVESSVKGMKGRGRAVLIVIVLQALGLGVGWAQGPAQPRIDEEIKATQRGQANLIAILNFSN